MYREWKEIELCWSGDVQRVEGNRIPKRVLYMNLETRRLRGRPRNRWQNEVREDGRIVGGKEWQEKVLPKISGNLTIIFFTVTASFHSLLQSSPQKFGGFKQPRGVLRRRRWKLGVRVRIFLW
jgi:hypothetical protein